MAPCSDHGEKPAMGGPAPLGQEHSAPFPAKEGRSTRRLSPPACHGAFSGFAPDRGNVPAVLVIRFFGAPTPPKNGIALFCFRKFVISIIVRKNRPVDTISQKS